MLEAVIFDVDGTVVDTFARQESWFKTWAAQNAVAWPFSSSAEFRAFYNNHINRTGGVQNVYDELHLSCNLKDKTYPVWPAYEAFNQQTPSFLYSGMKETITQIWEMGQLNQQTTRNRRLGLGINTTNSWRSIYGDLERAGVLPYFDCFVTEEILREYQGAGNGDALKKPSKVSLALALGLMDCNGAQTLHIGDTLNDLRASQKIIRLRPQKPETVITVGACYGYEGWEVLERGVETASGRCTFDYLIDQPQELIAIVQKNLEEK